MAMIDRRSHAIGAWLDDVSTRDRCTVRSIPLRESRDWRLADGRLSHRTGRFFHVVGARWQEAEGTCEQPLIDQSDVGLLGMLMRAGRVGPEMLAYGKVEPGNVGLAQVAPTCQATTSNIDRAHGGAAPPCAEWFQANVARWRTHSSQSEQATRFLGKRNRNVVAWDGTNAPSTSVHRWWPLDQLLEQLDDDFTVNTDTRSVLATTAWTELVNRRPFTRHADDLSAAFARSFSSPIDPARLEAAAAATGRAARAAPRLLVVPLDELTQWRIDDEGVSPLAAGPFRIRQVEVASASRERTLWDQPLVDSATPGRVELGCATVDGVLRFGFIARPEPSKEPVGELGPTVCSTPGAFDARAGTDGPDVLLTCRQSDEGGRFFQDEQRYSLVRVDPESVADAVWLSLSEIQHLIVLDGWFTNEARSAISLVLSRL
jgi:oxidase EvaA